jgi:hypothetical protein
MQQSHLQGVLSNRELEASDTPILPGQRAPFTLTRRKHPYWTGGSRLRLILETNIQADAQIGPAYLIPAVQSHLPVIEKICRMTRGSDHEQALRLASQFAELGGWLYHDSGDYESAMH